MVKYLLIPVFICIGIAILSSGVSAQYDPMGYWSLDEGSGSTVSDASVRSNDGILYGGLSTKGWEDDCKVGYCLNFDGVDDYVGIPTNSSFLFSNELTVEAWVKFQSKSVDMPILTRGWTRPFVLSWDADRGFNCEIRNSTNNKIYLKQSADIALNEWYHVACVYNGSHARLYVNGIGGYWTQLGGNLSNYPSDIRIGTSVNFDRYFNGTIDEVGVYNRTLSESEIYEQYNLEESTTTTTTTIPSGALSRLHVDGMYVKDENDEIVQLTGVHWADLADKSFFYYGPGVVNWRSDLSIRTGIVKEMGANHVRYSVQLENFINPYTYTGAHQYDSYSDVMDNAVQELVDNELYGYFTLHYGSSSVDDFMRALIDNNPWTFVASDYNRIEQGRYESPAVRDDWMDWCEQLARYYKNTPNVFGFQIWAEPAWAGFDRTADDYVILFREWWQFNLETAQAIHRGNPDAIVIVMSPGYYWTGYMSPNQWDGRNGAEYGPLPEPNIMYGVQKYESEDWRGGWSQKNYIQAYEDWHDGAGTLENARSLQEDWYLEYCFDFAEEYQVPVINTEFAYCDDLLWNYKDNVDWSWQSEQAQGFYDIWKEYGQGWTQHRWQIGTEYGGGSPWGFFSSMDSPNVGDYELAPSGELMVQNFADYEATTSNNVFVLGQLRNDTGLVGVNVTVFNRGTNEINRSQIATDSGYILSIVPGVYDLQYNIIDFPISDFWIKLLSLNIGSNRIDTVTNVSKISDGVSFRLNITGSQTIQIHSDSKPKSVKVDGAVISEGYLPLSTNEWYYDPSKKILYISLG